MAMEVVDFIPQLRTIDPEFLEYVMLFSRWRESEEVAAFHLLLCLWMYSSKTTEGSLTPCLKTGACARPLKRRRGEEILIVIVPMHRDAEL